MNREDIIRLSREAGIADSWDLNWQDKIIERFAKLVAQHEREACAGLCDVQALTVAESAKVCAEAIRARNKQDGECKHCTDGCPACDARKLQKEAHDLL